MAASSSAEAPTLSYEENITTPKEQPPSLSPVEMNNLPPDGTPRPGTKPTEDTDAQHTTAGAEQESTDADPEPLSNSKPRPIHPTPTRKASEALGPATENPIVVPATATGPTLSITLMLTTGARHPYKIDEKYLTNRKVESVGTDGTFDPRAMSAYKLKELIWTDWRSEWEPKPASPSSIRLIILGRMLDDKAPLKDAPFKLDETNVVHMTVKPADFLDDDDAGHKTSGKRSSRGVDGEERTAGCRCVIL